MSNYRFQFYHDNKMLKKIAFGGRESKSVSIGRKDVDVLIPAEGISRMHAQLLYDGESVYLVDCNSSNGTFVNGKAVPGNEPMLLKNNDVVFFDRAGLSKLIVTEGDDRTDGVDGGVVTTIKDKLNKKDVITIGRSPECDIVLDHPTVSRKHATVRKTSDGRYLVNDEDSMNGVFINGERIKKVELTEKDKLFIGRFQLSLTGGQKNLSKGTAIKALAVSKKYRNGYSALKETTFDLPAGGLIAIMGPSGCGKSTLLKVLNGTIIPTGGNVYINGLDLIENFPYLKTQIGYVPQDDIVHKELTVRQSIYYAAKIRLNGISDEAIEKKMSLLFSKLNITGIQDNLVSAISGGQRKRVSIAVELLSDPAILFLDEPTSPLDPQTIDEFMGILRNLAETGTTIVMVTHKPEDLSYMDRVIFMAEGGSLVYYGDVGDYKNYFSVQTAIQVYANISGDKASYWINRFKTSQDVHDHLSTTQNKRKKEETNPVAQFYWLLSRYFKIKQNDWRNTLFMILQAPIIAFLICLVFKEIKLAVLFLTAISGIWFGINNSAREIVCEWSVYMRERLFNLMIMPYVFSKVFLLSVMAMLQSILFISVIYYNYNGDGHSVQWEALLPGILWMFIVTFCSSLLGLLISAANKTTEKAMTVVPVVIIPQIMLAGVVTVISSSVVELLSYFTIARWGTEGFTHVQTNVVETFAAPGKGIPVQQKLDAYDLLRKSFHETYGVVFGDLAGTLALNFIVLLLMSAILLACVWIFMVKKDKEQV